VVTADKPIFEQGIDKLIVNVDESRVSSGGTVLDVLDRSPGITVDRQGGTMSMNGKPGVQVMINGKIQRLPLNMIIQQLEGMPSVTIEKIELINNPASRYDAEGDAGIINIITKKSTTDGINGTAMAGLGYSHLSGYMKPIASTQIHHRGKKISWSGTYSMNGDRRWQQWNYERRISNPDLYSNTTTDRSVWWPIQRASLGAEWNVSERTSIAALISGFSDRWEMESKNRSYVSKAGMDSVAIHLLDKEINHWKHLMGNISLNHRFGNGIKFNIDLDYLYYHDYNPNDFTNDYSYYQSGETVREYVRTGKVTPINMGVLKMDLEREYLSIKVEAGLKTTFSRLQNNVSLENKIEEQWIADQKFTQQYRLRDDVNAVYISASGPLGARSQLQLGLRGESTDMEMTAAGDNVLFKLDYWKLFPTAFYTWKINSRSSLQISYGKRISRPAYTSVAPFVIFMDPFTYYWGNLELKPAISNTLQTTLLSDGVQFTLKYSHDQNAIASNQSRYVSEEQKTYIYASNVDQLQLVSFSTSVPLELTTWWKTQNTALVTYQKTEHKFNGTPINLNQVSARLATNQSISLPRQFTVDLTGIYVAPRRMGLSLLKTVIEVSAGLQKKINERSRLNLSVTDIFWTRNSIYIHDNPVLGQIQKTSYYNEPRVWRLSYTYGFGNHLTKGKQRTTASDAEQQRVN
jgi:hypothetical protein